MLKTLALSPRSLLSLSGLALAETTTTRDPSTGGSSLFDGTIGLPSDVYKADVYDPSEHKVGKVTDLMIDSNGKRHGRDHRRRGFPWRWPERRRDSLQGAESLDSRRQVLAWSSIAPKTN